MSWESVERRVERGPMGLWAAIVAFFVVVSITGYFLSWFGEAGQVAQKEFGAKAALQKYEWFVDQANRIEKMDRDITLFDGRVKGVESQYESYGSDRASWSPDVRIQYNQAKQQAKDDLVAIASQRNGLVAEYNAASEKFNWKAFQTRPDKPKERFFEYRVE
ncbi:MAG: hypothetical protein HGA31_02635 [Candidatus Moranbacteria bacterium]|nr:hypothetical protein [Candidatus Moranbacteria bacterium]